MPGKGSKFTPKEDRQAKHVMESEEKEGKSAEKAEEIGYATVNKQKPPSPKKK